MDLCNQSCSSSWLLYISSSMANTSFFGHYTQTFQPNSFRPAMLIGIVDFYHLPLSLTLNLAGGKAIQVEHPDTTSN